MKKYYCNNNKQFERYIQLHNSDFNKINELTQKINNLEDELKNDKELILKFEKYSNEMKSYLSSYINRIDINENQRDTNYRVLLKEIDKIKNDIKQIQLVLNSQNSRINKAENNISSLSLHNNTVDKQIQSCYILSKDICDEYENIRCELIQLQSKQDVINDELNDTTKKDV